MNQRRLTYPLTALGLVVVAAVFLVLAFVAGGRDITPGQNLILTGRDSVNAPIDANDSPSIVQDPIHPDNLVAVDRVDRPNYTAALHYSEDGGNSWLDTALPLPPGRDRAYAPDVAFSSAGTLYVLYVNLQGTGNDPQTLWLARSNDGGATLQGPFAVTNTQYVFQAQLAVDTHGVVYVTWLHGISVGTLTLNSTDGVLLSKSSDAGQTWSTPVHVSDASRQYLGAPQPVIDSNGNVEVLYEDFNGDARDFLNLEGPPWNRPFSLVLARSTDGGRTFAPGVVVDSDLVASGRFLVYLPRFPSLAAGPGGVLYAAWADARTGTDTVYVRHSADGGQTWSAPVRMTGAPSGGSISQFMPHLAVAPGGRVDVLFLAGHRNTGDALVNAYLASSGDQGQTFTATRVSSVSFSSNQGPVTGPSYLPPDLGSKIGLASDDGNAYAVWTDTRENQNDNGRQDIFFSRVVVSGGIAWWAMGVTIIALIAAAAVEGVWLSQVRRTRAARPAEADATPVA